MDKQGWLASLKAGDEVAVGPRLLRVASASPKLIRLNDGRVFFRETGIMRGPAVKFRIHGRPYLRSADAFRRDARISVIRSALGERYHDCGLSSDALKEICEVLARHGRAIPADAL